MTRKKNQMNGFDVENLEADDQPEQEAQATAQAGPGLEVATALAHAAAAAKAKQGISEAPVSAAPAPQMTLQALEQVSLPNDPSQMDQLYRFRDLVTETPHRGDDGLRKSRLVERVGEHIRRLQNQPPGWRMDACDLAERHRAQQETNSKFASAFIGLSTK